MKHVAVKTEQLCSLVAELAGEREQLIKALKIAAGALDDDTIALHEAQATLLSVGATEPTPEPTPGPWDRTCSCGETYLPLTPNDGRCPRCMKRDEEHPEWGGMTPMAIACESDASTTGHCIACGERREEWNDDGQGYHITCR